MKKKVPITDETLLREDLSSDRDAIVAPATNVSHPSAIAIIRVSGQHSHKTLLKTLPEATKTTHGLLKTTRFRDVETKELIDDAMVVFFHGPSSYTGENSAELHLHGSPFIVRKALANLQKSGFRLAEPGEFTKRAYLNQKLDLVASEGINKLIAASSEQEWLSAKYLLEGTLQNEIKRLHKNLLEVMAFLEAQIDFPEEEDTLLLTRAILKEKALKVLSTINHLIASYENGKITSEGLKIALIGPTNAGKSSLMNYFLQKNRAIVTPNPGTTRDYLEEKCLLNGRLISIIDTAGIRETNDLIEREGVAQAHKIANEVDLILFLFPCDQEQDSFQAFNQAISNLKQLSHLKVMSKSDLGVNHNFETMEDHIAISCKTKENLKVLTDKIIEKVDFHTNEFKNNVSITSTRHLVLLENAQQRLNKFILEFDHKNYDEILAFELREINQVLAKIIGEIHTDDLLEEIFSRFCIGK